MASYLLSAFSSLWSGEGTAVLLSTAAEYGRNPLSDLGTLAVHGKSEPAPRGPSAPPLWQLRHEQALADGALTAAAAAAAAAAAELLRPAGDWYSPGCRKLQSNSGREYGWESARNVSSGRMEVAKGEDAAPDAAAAAAAAVTPTCG